MRTGPLAVAGWVVAAGLTLGVSWSAVQVVRGAVAPADLAVSSTDSLPPLPEPDRASPSATATPRPTASPTGRSAARSGLGGTVVVRCAGGTPQLVRAVPQQGFAVDPDDPPVEVRFTSAEHRTEIRASCAGGVPRFTVEEDDRGGDGDNSGPGGGGSSGPGGGDDD